MMQKAIVKCEALGNLVPFVQFKKHGKYHGGVLLLVKLQVSACIFTKSNTPSGCFSRFLNCTNGITNQDGKYVQS